MHNINNFKVLNYFGVTDGTSLIPDFNFNIIKNKYLEIKRIKFDFYAPYNKNLVYKVYSTDKVNFVAGYYELIPSRGLMPLDFISNYLTEISIRFELNKKVEAFIDRGGGVDEINKFAGAFGYNSKFDLDNLSVVTGEPITKIDIGVLLSVVVDYTAILKDYEPCNTKCMMEVFLHDTNPLLKTKFLEIL